MSYPQLAVNGWSFSVSSDSLNFGEYLVNQGVSYINQWQRYFPVEETWIQTNFGVPSLIIRLDCTVDDEGNLRLYEIEERPAGIGISTKINSDFAGQFGSLRQVWPEFSVLFSADRPIGDDVLWTNVSKGLTVTSLVLVRSEPNDDRYYHLKSNSVSTIEMEGVKSYGLAMGLWREVSLDNPPSKDEAFVLKPVQGTKARGVEFWVPWLRDFPGVATWSRINKVLAQYGTMYCQPFIEPMKTGIVDYPYKIYRIFYGFNPCRREWGCLGGCWVARRNLKIHGASDSLIGPMVVA